MFDGETNMFKTRVDEELSQAKNGGAGMRVMGRARTISRRRMWMGTRGVKNSRTWSEPPTTVHRTECACVAGSRGPFRRGCGLIIVGQL